MNLTDYDHDIIQSPSFVPCNVTPNDDDSKDTDHKPNSRASVDGSGSGGDGFDMREEKKLGMTDIPLPELVSEASPGTTYQTDNNISEPISSTVFEAWDKLMDDDQTNESYWKDILEYVD
ncbi:hypothetical protein L484_000010 [Morus notabilis]|uniref:Uncharacterized protein n=1 Tax=Morus notabilis TaxID=981085 RepID=W9SMW2_9ROSA|nr:hypothetical protein L484_000010 [Morus notabilis]